MNLYSFEKKTIKSLSWSMLDNWWRQPTFRKQWWTAHTNDKSQDQRSTFYFSKIQKQKLSLIDVFLRSNVSFLSPAFSLLSAFSDSNEKCFARCYIGNITRQQARWSVFTFGPRMGTSFLVMAELKIQIQFVAKTWSEWNMIPVLYRMKHFAYVIKNCQSLA